MLNWVGTRISNFLLVALIGGLVAMTGQSEPITAHADKSNKYPQHTYSGATLDSGHVETSDHATLETADEYCHPELDCNIVAAFLSGPTPPTRATARASKVMVVVIESGHWTPSSEKPPPRLIS